MTIRIVAVSEISSDDKVFKESPKNQINLINLPLYTDFTDKSYLWSGLIDKRRVSLS